MVHRQQSTLSAVTPSSLPLAHCIPEVTTAADCIQPVSFCLKALSHLTDQQYHHGTVPIHDQSWHPWKDVSRMLFLSTKSSYESQQNIDCLRRCVIAFFVCVWKETPLSKHKKYMHTVLSHAYVSAGSQCWIFTHSFCLADLQKYKSTCSFPYLGCPSCCLVLDHMWHARKKDGLEKKKILLLLIDTFRENLKIVRCHNSTFHY